MKKESLFPVRTVKILLRIIPLLIGSDFALAEEEAKSTSAHQPDSQNDKGKESQAPKVTEEQAMEKEVKGVYVQIPAFQVPVIQDRVHKTNFLLEIVIEARDHEKAIRVYQMRAKLIDAIFVDLYSVFAVIWHPLFHVELDELKERLFKICLKVLGRSLMKDVLIQNFTVEFSGNG